MTIIIAIEGNIGSGKSTMVDYLKSQYNNTILFGRKVVFLQEPVKQWQEINSDGETILEKFYANQEKWAFSFQMMAYISRLDILRKAVKENPNGIIFTERSLFTDKNVFAQMLYDDKKINEIDFQIYNKWFHSFIEEIPISGIVYIKTEPETCSARVEKRARKGESIPLEYLTQCSQYHDNWIINKEPESSKLVLDGNVDNVENPGIVNSWLKSINDFTQNLVFVANMESNCFQEQKYPFHNNF